MCIYIHTLWYTTESREERGAFKNGARIQMVFLGHQTPKETYIQTQKKDVHTDFKRDVYTDSKRDGYTDFKRDTYTDSKRDLHFLYIRLFWSLTPCR